MNRSLLFSVIFTIVLNYGCFFALAESNTGMPDKAVGL